MTLKARFQRVRRNYTVDVWFNPELGPQVIVNFDNFTKIGAVSSWDEFYSKYKDCPGSYRFAKANYQKWEIVDEVFAIWGVNPFASVYKKQRWPKVFNWRNVTIFWITCYVFFAVTATISNFEGFCAIFSYPVWIWPLIFAGSFVIAPLVLVLLVLVMTGIL